MLLVRRPRRRSASSRVYLYSMRRPSPDYIKAGAAAVSCSRSELPFNSRPQRAKIRASFCVLSYARHLSFCVDNSSDVMRGFLLVLLTALFALAVTAEKYPEKYDNVDVDRILQNNRVLTNYIRCLMDEGPCTAEGRELRKTLPDALSTGCNKCNDKQKTTAEKVINHLKMKRSKDWDRLISKYDPNGEYRKRFERS